MVAVARTIRCFAACLVVLTCPRVGAGETHVRNVGAGGASCPSDALSLLQYGASYNKAEAEISPSSDSRSIQPPSYYMRIPGSGSSFTTTLERVGGVLNFDVTPDGARLGKVATMLRKPLRRVLSGYHAQPNALRDCEQLQQKYKCSNNGHCDGDVAASPQGQRRNPERIPPSEYAHCVENCATNVLTGRSCSATGVVDVDAAKAAIDRMQFVGMTDHWGLSVCLFHTRFGGECKEDEFDNMRQGPASSSHGGGAAAYDETYWEQHLGDWRPVADTEVYSHALVRFRRELKDYNVTPHSCVRMCPAPIVAFESFPEMFFYKVPEELLKNFPESVIKSLGFAL